MAIQKCGNCVLGVIGGAVCSFCQGTTFISDNESIMDEQSTAPASAPADSSVTIETPVVEAQTTETQSITEDAGVQVAAATPAESPEVNG